MPTNTTPYAGVSAERLTDLINQDNGSALQVGVDFTFGPPSNYSDGTARNTQVTLTPVIGTGYPKPETVHYERLPLTVLNDLPQGWVKPVLIDHVPFTLNGILDDINAALGIDLALNEIVNQVYDNAQTSYRLPIANNLSLTWIDSDFTFQAVFPGNAKPLNSVVTSLDLAGFDAVSTPP